VQLANWFINMQNCRRKWHIYHHFIKTKLFQV
jgi:hypothetical protein